MFETLSDKLSGSLRKVRGRGRLTEDNVGQTLNEVKMALLEADVNFRVVKAFLRSVKARAVGEEVQGSLTPGQQFIKIVNEELTEMMGGANSGLVEPETAPDHNAGWSAGFRKNLIRGKTGAALSDRRQTALFNSCRYLPTCCNKTAGGSG
jgi:hypothetical protein